MRSRIGGFLGSVRVNMNYVWATICILLLTVIGAFALVTLNIENAKTQEADDIQCIAAYNNAFAARSAILAGYVRGRDDALRADKIALSVFVDKLLSPKATEPQRLAALEEYQKVLHKFVDAADAYAQALNDNPLPPPVNTCSDRLKSRHHAAGVSATPQPSAPSTVTATASVTVTAPGATRTRVSPTTMSVRGPGSTSTVTAIQTQRVPGPRVTVTRAVTRTVAPPPCFPIPHTPCTIG